MVMKNLLSDTIPTGRYRHYKGKEYELLAMALHSETLENMVVYKPLYETPDVPSGTLWVRPAAMFLEMVETADGKVQRFTPLTA
jgi:hypothetical protein